MTKCNELFKNKLINKSTKTCEKVKTKLNDNNIYSRYVLRTMKNIKEDVYLPVKEVYSKYKNGFLKNLTGLNAKEKRNCITCSKTMLKYGAKLKSCEGLKTYKINLRKKDKQPIFKVEKVIKPDDSQIKKDYKEFNNLEKKINFKSKTSKISNASLSTQLLNINNLENNITFIKNNIDEIQSVINNKKVIKPSLKALPIPKKKELNVKKLVNFKPSNKIEFNNLDPPLAIMKPSKFDVDKSKFSKNSINTELSKLNEIKDYTHNKKKKKLLKSKKFKDMSTTNDNLDAYKNYVISETPINDDELYNQDPLTETEEWNIKKPKMNKIAYIDDDVEVDENFVEKDNDKDKDDREFFG